MLNYGIAAVAIFKVHIKSTIVSHKGSSKERKRKGSGGLSEQDDVVDARGIYIKRVIKLSSADGHGIRRNNFVIPARKLTYDGIGEIDFLMFWNWRNLGPQVLLSLLEKQKYDRNFHLVYKISLSLSPKFTMQTHSRLVLPIPSN